MPHVKVELPGLTLTNEPGQRDRAFLVDLKNWHSATETKRDSEQRENGLGLYRDDDPEEGGRYPIVYGRLLSRREGDEWPLRAAVMALKNLPTLELAVTDPTGRWQAEVAVSGRIVFEIHDDGWADFEIPLEADDPRRYGARRVLSTGVPTPGVGIADPLIDPVQEGAAGNLGRVSLVNGGTAPSEPMVRVSGGLSEGFEVLCVETARMVRVVRPIPDGSVVDVDMGSGTVWIDQQSPLAATYVPVAEWISVGPGETCTLQFTPYGVQSGTPTMTVEFAEASW